MKLWITLISLLTAFTASAGEFSQPDSVLFQTASTWVPAHKVCRDGNFLKHKEKEYVAVEHCAGDSNSNCETVYKKLLQPVVGVGRRCTDMPPNRNCKVWEAYPFNQGSVRLRTYNSKQAYERGNSGRITGRYVIPACVK